MSRLADKVIANLFVTLGVRNDLHGNPLPVLYDQLFETIHPQDDEDYVPRGTKRDKYDDIIAFEQVWEKIEQDERLLTGLKSVQDVAGRTIFAKAVQYDCLEITKMLIYENFGDIDVAYLWSFSPDCSHDMYTLLIKEGFLDDGYVKIRPSHC